MTDQIAEENFKSLIQNGMSISHSFPCRYRDLLGRKGMKMVKVRGGRWVQGNCFPWNNRAHKLTVRFKSYAQDLRELKPGKIQNGRWTRRVVPSPAEELLAFDSSQETNSESSLMVWLLDYWPHFRAGVVR